jgi:uncharacterized protein HemX
MLNEKDQTQTDEQIDKKKSKRKSILKWSLIILLVLAVFTGYKFYTVQKAMAARRETFEKQRQVMMEHWQEQGLSEEEIDQKMQEMRQERSGQAEDHPAGMSFFRMIRGGGGGRGFH